MLMQSQQKKIIDYEFSNDNYHYRFCNFIDEKTREFEDEKIRKKDRKLLSFIDDNNITREIFCPNLSFWQSYHYLVGQENDFYILQMINIKTNHAYQIVVSVEISRLELFKFGTIRQWFASADNEYLSDQVELIKQLKISCKNLTNLISLRIQTYIAGNENLNTICSSLKTLAFQEVLPKSYTKTRFIDLRPELEEIKSQFSSNSRARIKIKEKDKPFVEIYEIFNRECIPSLQKALNDSYQRSSSRQYNYNFSYLFDRTQHFLDEVVMLGFFLKDSGTSPKAFITGIRHDNIVEFSTGGSMSDSKLRKYPFNHILMWQLAIRSKLNGAHFLDMGGIADINTASSLQGINNFKRFFPGFEVNVGREMQLDLKPKSLYFYSLIQKIKQKIF
jgi:hypothetical protein